MILPNFNVRFRISGTTLCRGECEINEQMEWCPEGDTHEVSELITHSPLIIIYIYLYHMNVTITESKFIKVLHTYLNMSFEGFDDMYYDWSEFNCGMGICCDPYAISFVLPRNEHNNYLFKLVNVEYYDDDGDYPANIKGDLPEPCYNRPDVEDENFDVIVLSEDMSERLNDFFNDINVWKEPLLSIINNVFNTNAKDLMYFTS